MISLAQTKQLIQLIKETNIGDMKWRNLVHCENGKIAMIDTETFTSLLYGLSSLWENNSFEKGAAELVYKEIEYVRNNPYMK